MICVDCDSCLRTSSLDSSIADRCISDSVADVTGRRKRVRGLFGIGAHKDYEGDDVCIYTQFSRLLYPSGLMGFIGYS